MLNLFEATKVANALVDELRYLTVSGETEGSIGIENLGETSGYAYASMGGHGNMGSYISTTKAAEWLLNYLESLGEEEE